MRRNWTNSRKHCATYYIPTSFSRVWPARPLGSTRGRAASVSACCVEWNPIPIWGWRFMLVVIGLLHAEKAEKPIYFYNRQWDFILMNEVQVPMLMSMSASFYLADLAAHSRMQWIMGI